MVSPGGLFNTRFFPPRASIFSARERTLSGKTELVGTNLTALEISWGEDELPSKSPSSMSFGVSQSGPLSRHINFCIYLHITRFFFQSEFLDDGNWTKLCQIVFGDLPKFASTEEQFNIDALLFLGIL